jgi:hypothetical protein
MKNQHTKTICASIPQEQTIQKIRKKILCIKEIKINKPITDKFNQGIKDLHVENYKHR